MKITIYELLGLVKDGKAPKTILYSHIPYQLKRCEYVSCDGEDDYLFSGINIVDILNDEVEILEEEKKIPEKLEDISEIKCVGCKVEINIAGNKTLFDTDTPIVTEHCIYKINQLIKNQKKIIDYLKSKGD